MFVLPSLIINFSLVKISLNWKWFISANGIVSSLLLFPSNIILSPPFTVKLSGKFHSPPSCNILEVLEPSSSSFNILNVSPSTPKTCLSTVTRNPSSNNKSSPAFAAVDDVPSNMILSNDTPLSSFVNVVVWSNGSVPSSSKLSATNTPLAFSSCIESPPFSIPNGVSAK